MTRIREGAQAQGTALVEGAVSVAQSAARTADRLSRSLSRHLERVARQNEEGDRREREARERREATTGRARREQFLRTGVDPEVTRASDQVQRGARPQPVGVREPIMPIDMRNSDGTVTPNVPAASVNAVRDANRTVAQPGTGAYEVRGYGTEGNASGRMLRVDYGDGPVQIADPGTQEMIREVVEQNPRAFPDFASWVNTVMGLRGEPLTALNAERLAYARREWEMGSANASRSPSRAVPFDASFMNSKAYAVRRGDVMYSAEYDSVPGNNGSRIRTSEPVFPRIGESPAAERVPLTSEEINRGQSDLMGILQETRRVGAETRSRAIAERNRRNPAPPNEFSIPNYLRASIRAAVAEGDARRRLAEVQRENDNIRSGLGRVAGPEQIEGKRTSVGKQDAGTGEAKAADAQAISMQDNTGDIPTMQDTTPVEGVTVTGSRTLQRRSEQELQGTSSRLQRLEDRIRNSSLAPVAAAAAVVGGADIDVTDNISVNPSEGRIEGRWRW